MAVDPQNTILTEVEFELNRRDILHCRTLILGTADNETITLLAPPPVEHGYAFKSGDRIDLYLSRLQPDRDMKVEHLKTKILRAAEGPAGPVLLIQAGSFRRLVHRSHFFMLKTQSPVDLEALDIHAGIPGVPADITMVTPESLHVTTTLQLPPGSRWVIAFNLDGHHFKVAATTDDTEPSSTLSSRYTSGLQITQFHDGSALDLADTIAAIQTQYLLNRFGEGLQKVYRRSDLQDALVLEHLVPRSARRRLLDYLELTGWALLVLACFNALQAMPPGVDFFDRVFLLQPTSDWNPDLLRRVPVLLLAQLFVLLISAALHALIFFKGNTRPRISLWVLGAAGLFLFLAIGRYL